MGAYFSRFYYQLLGYARSPAQIADDQQKREDEEDKPCCSSPASPNSTRNDDENNNNNNNNEPPKFETPQKVLRKNGAKIFAAYVPDSPERFAFTDFTELKSFLNSPVGKKKGTRFKQCQDEQDLDQFYSEQQLSGDPGADESGSSAEPDLPYKDLPARRLTEFRMAIERREDEKFEELLRESPRFLVNTSNDLPTILHIGMRCNALHIACRTSNAYATRRILQLVKDTRWLRDAYATDACMRERSANLLDAMLNTPDKIENNAPLHYACRALCEPIFWELIGHEQCHRSPVNSHDERPIDVLGRAAKGSRQENKRVFDRMYVALEGSMPSIQRRRRSAENNRSIGISIDQDQEGGGDQRLEKSMDERLMGNNKMRGPPRLIGISNNEDQGVQK